MRASLRGKEVYALADASGKLVSSSGRVEVRFQRNDGRRYHAAVANLTVTDAAPLPDETCGPADDVASRRGASDGTGRAARSTSRGSGLRAAGSTESGADSAGSAGHGPGADTGRVVAYTDGACSGNPGPAGLGVVLLREGRQLELSEYLGVATNNIAELTAVMRALEALDETTPASIYTDSQYTIGVVQKGWKAKANAELIAELKQLFARRRATLFYVRGHAGHPLNERADELARAAVTRRGSERRER